MESNVENWKPIPTYEDYAASDLGNIKRITRGQGTYPGKPRGQYVNPVTGYLNCTLGCKHNPKLRKTMSAHKLVAMTWVPNPNNYSQVRHINGIKTDNRACNLEWVEVARTNRDTHIVAVCQETGEEAHYYSVTDFCKAEDIVSPSHVYLQLSREGIFKHPYKNGSWLLKRVPGSYY